MNSAAQGRLNQINSMIATYRGPVKPRLARYAEQIACAVCLDKPIRLVLDDGGEGLTALGFCSDCVTSVTI